MWQGHSWKVNLLHYLGDKSICKFIFANVTSCYASDQVVSVRPQETKAVISEPPLKCQRSECLPQYSLCVLIPVYIIWSAHTAGVVSVPTFPTGCLSSFGTFCMWWHSRYYGNSVLLPVRCCSHSACGTRWTKSRWLVYKTEFICNGTDIIVDYCLYLIVACFFLGVQEYSESLDDDLHCRGTKSIF